jgi:two-component system NarL family sensor kinase
MAGMDDPSAPGAIGDRDAMERRNRELGILNEIAASLNASVDLHESMRAALSGVAELLGLRTGWVFLLDDAGEPHLEAAQNLPTGLAREPERMENGCYCLDTYRAGDLGGAANVNVVTCSRLKGLVSGRDGLRYHASIPLYARGRRLGIMNVASPDWRELSPGDLRLLYTVGDLLAIAIERARLYARSAEAGAAEERNRLAREIHDTLAQGLTGIALQIETAEALLDDGADGARIRAALERALAQTRSSLDEARRSVQELRAAPLEGQSLAEALMDLGAGDARLRVDVPGEARLLSARAELGIYRIAQEAVANALRHAHATQVRVTLEIAAGSARLTVQDDGAGFDPSTIERGRFGIVGMRERARLLGGSLHIESGPGDGTRIEAEVPA